MFVRCGIEYLDVYESFDLDDEHHCHVETIYKHVYGVVDNCPSWYDEMIYRKTTIHTLNEYVVSCNISGSRI
jgi:hypothetical protein